MAYVFLFKNFIFLLEFFLPIFFSPFSLGVIHLIDVKMIKELVDVDQILIAHDILGMIFLNF